MIFFAVVSGSGFTHAEIEGASDENLNCYWGMVGATEAETGIKPLKEGAVCKVTPIGDNPALALECAGIEKPVVTSTCQKGKCVATLGCEGKPLMGQPDIDAGKPDPLKPAPQTPTPTPTPSPTPRPTPAPGSGTSVVGGSTPDIPEATLPPITVIQGTGDTGSTKPNPGIPLNPQGPAYSLQPGRGSSGNGLTGTGGASDEGGSLSGNNTTFSESIFGSGSNTGVNGFVNLISNILGTFLPLFTGGGSSSGNASSDSRPTPSAPSMPSRIVQPPLQVAQGLDPRTLSILNALEQNKPLPQPAGPLTERTGLDTLIEEQTKDDLLTGGAPQDGGKLTVPPDALQNPDEMLPSSPPPPIIVDIADAGQVRSDASPPVPEYVSALGPHVEKEFITQVEQGLSVQEAYAAARSRTVNETFSGLESGTLGSGSEEVAAARRILEQDLSLAKQTRDRAYLTQSLPFQELIDKTFGGIFSSSYKRAVDTAEARLALLGDLEGTARISALAGSLQPPPTPERPSIITVTNEPISEEGFRSIPTPVDVARAVYSWWTGPSETPAPLPVEAPRPIPLITPPAPAVTPTPPTPAQVPAPVPTPPVAQPEPSKLLEGLSAVAKRVYEGVNTVARQVGLGGVKTPAPVGSATQPSPETSSGASGGMMRAGISLLSAFIQNLSSLFSNDSGSNKPNQVAQPLTPSAAIVTNPSLIDLGETTKLSWTSIGALSCIVVDTELRIIAGDATNGDVESPVLEKSTRFGVICDIAGGRDKFVNETLVRVRGDESDPKPLFAQQGRISQSAAVNLPAVNATTAQALDEQTPLDVRTCEPNQPMESFIRCLCDAEPNPNGCSLVPR